MIPLEQGRNMGPPGASDPSGGVDSGVLFAATLLIIVGLVQTLQGVAAMINPEHFSEASDYAFRMSVTTWGWVHLVFGIVLVFAGANLFRGRKWAGMFAIVMAGLSAIANFLFIPHYPFWGIIIVLLAIWVVWSIIASGVLED